jgi:glycosyltransferase involved in cell wall biosynthesis
MAELLSIIIPIYNEERIISTSLPKIFDLEINKEIIIINDGSKDKTESILKDLQKKYSFNLINKETNSGKGNSVKLGLENIQGDYFIVCDADTEYDPQDIVFLFDEIKKIYQTDSDKKIAIYGSRFLNKKNFSLHHFVNWTLTATTNSLFGGHLTDMETCFKLIPKEALKNIKLKGGRFEIEPEITAKLIKNDYKIIEKPISYKPRGYSEGKKIKARDWLLAIGTLFSEKLFKR